MTRPRPEIVVLLLCGIAALAFAAQPASVAGWLVVYDIVAVTTVLVFSRAVRRIDSRARGAWLLLLAGQILSVIGDIAYDLDGLRGQGIPWLGEIVYALSGVARLAALVVVVRRRSPGRNGLVWVDAALIGTTALALIAAFVLIPAHTRAGDVSGEWLLVTGYLVFDAITVAVVVRLVSSSTDSTSVALWLVLGAQVVFMASDVAFAVAATSATDESTLPGVVQAGWLVSYVILAYAASRPDAAMIIDPGPAHRTRLNPLGFLAVAGATLVVPVALVVLLAEQDDRVTAVLTACNLVIVVLLMLRSWLLLRVSQAQSDHLAELARTDALTGLPNRRRWEHLLHRAVTTAGVLGDPLVVAMGDLDGFKQFNDRHGHPAGDDLLQECARAWAATLPADAVIARLGGDEFAILLPEHTTTAARRVLDRIVAATPTGVTLSLGATECHPGVAMSQLESDADIALYAAKRHGGGRVEFFDSGGSNSEVSNSKVANSEAASGGPYDDTLDGGPQSGPTA